MTENPLQSAEAHIDPVVFAEALAELDWTPRAELKELVDIIRDAGTNIRHKMGAMQILRSRIIENLELSGAIQLVQERIRGRLPGAQYTAERSRYLTPNTVSTVHGHLETLDTERRDMPAPSQTLEHPDDNEPEDAPTVTRSPRGISSRVGQDDLENDGHDQGPGPVQPNERPPTANTGDPPEPAPGNTDDAAAPAPAAEGSEADAPGEVEPFKPRKPEARPAFGRPLGRRTPTKSTIGGGICGPAPADQ